MKVNKTKVMSYALALVMSTSTIALSTSEAYAEGINSQTVTTSVKPKNGSFIDEPMEYEESQYLRYVVEKGDNISKISRKICKYFDEEPTTKYWPVLAFLNEFPRTIQPGDVLIFPGTFEDVDGLWQDLNDAGWIKKYVKENNVYGSKKKKRETVGSLIAEIYGESACADPDFVSLYLEAQGLSQKYNIDSVIDGNDMLFELTEWIPTIEELKEYRRENPLNLKKVK